MVYLFVYFKIIFVNLNLKITFSTFVLLINHNFLESLKMFATNEVPLGVES